MSSTATNPSIPGLDRPLDAVIQGTMMLEELGEDASLRLLDGVFELGGTTFDTAHVYGGGECERIFGRWLESRGLRDEVVVVGKGCEPSDERSRVTPEDLTADLLESLERMRLERVQLYLVHVDDPGADVGPLVECLDLHRRAGRIGAYGVSNWSSARIEAANGYAAAHGLAPLVASSVNLSLAVQRELPWRGNVSISGPGGAAERDFYLRTGMPVLTWSSLAGGFFSGRFRRDNLEGFTDYFSAVTARAYGSEENFARLDRATEVGRRHGATAAQVALAWVMRQPLNVHPLVGSSTADEFRQNIEAAALPLSDDELRWIDQGSSHM